VSPYTTLENPTLHDSATEPVSTPAVLLFSCHYCIGIAGLAKAGASSQTPFSFAALWHPSSNHDLMMESDAHLNIFYFHGLTRFMDSPIGRCRGYSGDTGFKACQGEKVLSSFLSVSCSLYPQGQHPFLRALRTGGSLFSKV
jgi:hypothetical protein